MPKRNQKRRRNVRATRGLSLSKNFVFKGTTIFTISSSAGGTSISDYPSSSFSLFSGGTFPIQTPAMVQTSPASSPTYRVRWLKVTVRYLPAFGRSAGITGSGFAGSGTGYAAWIMTATPLSTFTTANLSTLRTARRIFTGRPFTTSIKPKSILDNPWVGSNTLLVPTTAIGWTFYFYLEKCDISITLGDLEFSWIIEAEMP